MCSLEITAERNLGFSFSGWAEEQADENSAALRKEFVS
jgi:hypothetical protein